MNDHMKEWTKDEWQQQLKEQDVTAFYLYTPMCGTCAVASKMMEVTQELLPDVPMGKANLNYIESVAYEYEIESVPCLLVSKNGEITEKVYAFQSVLNVYDILKKQLTDN